MRQSYTSALDADHLDLADAPRQGGKLRLFVAVFIALGLFAYWLSPVVALVNLGIAVRNGDAPGVASRINLPVIRRDLARQIVPVLVSADARYAQLSPLERNLARSALYTALDAWLADNITESNVMTVLKGGTPAGLPNLDRVGLGRNPFDNMMSLWQRSGFSGIFAYDVAVTDDASTSPVLQLRLVSSGWMLRSIILPEALIKSLQIEINQRAIAN